MTTSRKLIVLKGLQASGKSSHAREICDNTGRTKRINFDLLREMLDFKQHSRDNEKFVHKVAELIASEAFNSGYDVVMDNLNYSDNQTNLNKRIATDNKAYIKVIESDVDVWECISRDSKRGEKSVGRQVILDTWNRYVRPKIQAPVWNSDLPSAFVCDIDGTAMERVTDRSPFDMTRVYEDEPRQHVMTMVKDYIRSGVRVVFVSGRNESGRDETIRCFRDKCELFLDDYDLYMRKDGDNRPDYIIKKEIHDEHIKGKYNVLAVCDDREQVISRCWDELGYGDRIFRVGRVHADDF